MSLKQFGSEQIRCAQRKTRDEFSFLPKANFGIKHLVFVPPVVATISTRTTAKAINPSYRDVPASHLKEREDSR